MATAPGHRLGQIVGEALEVALLPVLTDFAAEHDLYLDKHGERSARSGLKLTWSDDLGNSHDLDFVLERGGTDSEIGIPAAFIEAAWRRYTKHSRNKAQEMQGAVLPLIARFADVKPFAGAIIGGNWTRGAIDQLVSSGFALVHIGYDEVVAAFSTVGIDVGTEESTSDDHLQEQVDAYEALSESQLDDLGEALRACAPREFEAFLDRLTATVVRSVRTIAVTPLHGSQLAFPSVAEAVRALHDYTPPDTSPPLVRFQIVVVFTNDDRIVADFRHAKDAATFLNTFD